MAYANLSEALKSTAFSTLSPEEKQFVFQKYSANDQAYKGLSPEEQQFVQQKYLGGAAGSTEAPKPAEKPLYDKAAEAVFGQGPQASMGGLERIKRVGESAVGGMAFGGIIGSVVPGAGTAVGAVTGLVAGAAAEIAEQATSALGGGRLLQVTTGLVASAPAEAIQKAVPTMLHNLLPSKAKYALSLLKDPSKLEAESRAILESGQLKQFGPKTPGYVAGQDLGTNAAETQARLQKEFKFGETRGYTATGATTEEAMKPGTALATGKEDLSAPMVGNKPAPGRTQKLEPIPPREAKIDPKTGQPETVSKVLRNEMYQEVGNVTVKSPSQRFSSSDEFKALDAKLTDYVDQGLISKADKAHLTTILKSDQGSLNSQTNYGKTVDRQIRKWAGKPDATGAAGLDNEAKNAVRNDLRDTFSQWTDKQGFGQIEKDYRSAFRQEKIAEAKDYIPRMLSEYDGKPQATQFARQMVNDMPETKELVKAEIKKYFANLDPKDIPKNLGRIDKLLVNTNIFKPEELTYLREQVAAVEKGGDPIAIGTRIKRMIDRQLKVKLPANAARSAIMGQMAGDNQEQQ